MNRLRTGFERSVREPSSCVITTYRRVQKGKNKKIRDTEITIKTIPARRRKHNLGLFTWE